jgi:peptide/nickel transport system permease protein
MSLANPNIESVNKTIKEENFKIQSRAAVVWKRYKKNKLAVVGLVIFTLIVLMAVFAPLISPHNPTVYDILDSNLAPSKKYPFGTDAMGGDIMTRSFYGARVSLSVAFLAMICTVTIGVIYGSIAGFFGGVVDNFMMRVIDAIQSIPTFFLLLIVASLIVPSLGSTIFVLSIVGWTGMARIVRGEILSLKTRDYIEAARATGETNRSIIFYHILPNAIAPIIVIATLDIAGNILSEAGLSFLGLGIQPPTPSWGNMLTAAQDLTSIIDYTWTIIFPGLFIIVTVLCVNFIGDGLRDALDPRMKQ